MPPESIKERKYSAYSDIWAFGVTLWEILARQTPFPELDPIQAALAVTNDGLRLIPPDFTPKVIKAVMQSCFKTIPEERGSFKEICHNFAIAAPSDWYPVVLK